MKTNILVTGGLGFIGSHITDALASETERKVIAYDINAQNSKDRNAIRMQGDVFDFDSLTKVMRNQEVSSVIHMVGLASIPDCRKKPDASFRLNVASVQNVLEAARQCDVDRIIFPSTAAVYGVANGPEVNEEVKPRASNIYGCHKLAAEHLIRGYAQNHGLKYVILRIFNVYGDLDKEQGVISLFIRKIFAGEPLILKGGGQLRDFVFLNDVVEAFIKSLDVAASSGKTINVGSGVGLSINEVAEMVQRSFPNTMIKHEPADKGEYSIYANVSRMKSLLKCSTTDPKIGIPKFIEKCKKTSATGDSV